ncbi:DUF4181 domain-containing protein [Metabacillus fastidiosus]|uniref:DUF4181 domain-containing protein n=1 Tax=Metabacillus fastidiosus TaxID=1458 RepID=UPI002DBCE50E|nr:DUF4181 domain-containing protein [Metabacillus fastidiosus]MEC2074533.1 DUF4181 domain-containing protein [Metabacillus fastidiosus]
MEFLLFLIILFILFILIEKLLRKWLRVEKKKISETSGKNVDRWGRGIILLIFLCSLPFLNIEDTNVIKWYWISYLTLLVGFQSFIQWKYLKNSKEYVISLICLMIGLIIICNIYYFI